MKKQEIQQVLDDLKKIHQRIERLEEEALSEIIEESRKGELVQYLISNEYFLSQDEYGRTIRVRYYGNGFRSEDTYLCHVLLNERHVYIYASHELQDHKLSMPIDIEVSLSDAKTAKYNETQENIEIYFDFNDIASKIIGESLINDLENVSASRN